MTILRYFGVTIILEYPKLSKFIQMFSMAIFTQIPICLVRNIEILHKISLFGTLALLYSVIVAIIEFPFYFRENYSYEKLKLWDFNPNVLQVLCMYFFAFANHNALLNVISELNKPTKEQGTKIVKYSFFAEFYIYLIVLFTGYLSTFDETNEIFIDRPGNSIFLVIGKILYIVSLTCHIGLYYFVCRPSIEMLVNDGKSFTERG